MMGENVFTPNQENALGLDGHISLTANAGSGKTSVLVERYLKIALDKNVDLSKIVAITYTEKAASDLYSKVSKRIEEKITESHPEERQKYILLRRQLYSAKISTIHSFCKDVIKEFAIEAKVDTDFSIADDTLNNELIDISFEEFKREYLSPNNPLPEKEKVKFLVRMFGSWGNLREVISQMISERRTVFQLREKLYFKTASEITVFFDKAYCDQIGLIVRPVSDDFISVIERVNSGTLIPPKKGNESVVELVNSSLYKFKTIVNSEGKSLESFKLLCEILDKMLTQKCELLANYKKEFAEGKEFEESDLIKLGKYGKLKDRLKFENGCPNLHNVLAETGKFLMEMFECVFSKYDQKKSETSLLDFEDLLLKTEEVIKNENVRDLLKERFTYIMIDEYQDTNEIQYNIFLPLVNYLTENNFFVVGDEKQSIYMFRDAELEVFRATRKAIQKQAGISGIQELEESFRMAPGLALFANIIFSKIMANPMPEFNEVNYSPIVSAKKEDLENKIEILLIDNNSGELADANCKEIQLIAKRIKLLKEESALKGLSYKDMAILCRKKNVFSLIEKVFTVENIPYSILGGDGFYQRQTVYDVYNYLSFLVNKDDDVALVGLLRSPFFLLSDADILEISLENINEPDKTSAGLWTKFNVYSQKRFLHNEIVKTLSENIKCAATLDVPSLIRKITEEGNFLSVISARKNGKAEIDNLEKLIKNAAGFVSSGYRILYDYTEFLRDAIDNQSGEGLVSPGDESDTVKILTIHKAKGLQYKFVFIVNMDTVPDSRGAISKTVKIAKNVGLLTKLPPNNDFSGDYVETPIQKTFEYIRRKKEIAESRRLFYVAVTRAENYLFMSGIQTGKPFKENSFFSFLSEGLQDNFCGNKIELDGVLKRAVLEEGKYEIVEFNEKIEIPIIREIVYEQKDSESESEVPTKDIVKVDIEKLIEFPSEEIYSATKISTFLQCPLKYKLTYELGFGKFSYLTAQRIHEKKKDKPDFEFNTKEEQGQQPEGENKSVYNMLSLFKGSIIHAALEKNVGIQEVDSLIEIILRNETDFTRYNLIPLESLTEKVKNTLEVFYNSETYKELCLYGNFKNEFEISVRDSDYILYGIIDKVVFEGADKLLIVDYKTDTIFPADEAAIILRGKGYINQLMFYAYLLSRVTEKKEIEIRIVFVSYPDIEIKENVKPGELNSFGKQIGECVKSIREKRFMKNPQQCEHCQFALNIGCCII